MFKEKRLIAETPEEAGGGWRDYLPDDIRGAIEVGEKYEGVLDAMGKLITSASNILSSVAELAEVGTEALSTGIRATVKGLSEGITALEDWAKDKGPSKMLTIGELGEYDDLFFLKRNPDTGEFERDSDGDLIDDTINTGDHDVNKWAGMHAFMLFWLYKKEQLEQFYSHVLPEMGPAIRRLAKVEARRLDPKVKSERRTLKLRVSSLKRELLRLPKKEEYMAKRAECTDQLRRAEADLQILEDSISYEYEMRPFRIVQVEFPPGSGRMRERFLFIELDEESAEDYAENALPEAIEKLRAARFPFPSEWTDEDIMKSHFVKDLRVALMNYYYYSKYGYDVPYLIDYTSDGVVFKANNAQLIAEGQIRDQKLRVGDYDSSTLSRTSSTPPFQDVFPELELRLKQRIKVDLRKFCRDIVRHLELFSEDAQTIALEIQKARLARDIFQRDNIMNIADEKVRDRKLKLFAQQSNRLAIKYNLATERDWIEFYFSQSNEPFTHTWTSLPLAPLPEVEEEEGISASDLLDGFTQ